MSDKVSANHLRRLACVYVRQSTLKQMERNRESTARQYRLVQRAVALGWPADRVQTIDDDQGLSGSGTAQRKGFESMTSEVALGRVGLILAIEVSRLARNNSDWYRLLDLCGMTDTLIGDEDGLYHPGLYNDRLLLGLKGTMSEAELHVIRARLNGGIWSKAARGQLRRALPIGFVWGEQEGQILLDPDEAVRGVIRAIFQRFAEIGSIRQVWIWMCAEKLRLPNHRFLGAPLRWIPPSYHAVRSILDNPIYAGVYRYGRTRQERSIDPSGRLSIRKRVLPPSEWQVVISGHHEGYIDAETYEMNRRRIKANARVEREQAGGALREGAALLQGLASCGRCGRKLKVVYQGPSGSPAYECRRTLVIDGASQVCLRVGGVRIDRAVADAFLEAIAPAGIEAALAAESEVEADREAVIGQLALQVEGAQYEADRAERSYRSVEPENRLVARTLEQEWEKRLTELAQAKGQLEESRRVHAHSLSEAERSQLRRLGTDLRSVWSAPTTSDRDRKELLHTLLEEVSIDIKRGESTAGLTMRWRGGAITELDVVARPPRVPVLRTDEETIGLLRRIAPHYPNATIAAILNRQGRRTVNGQPFTAQAVRSLRRSWKLPEYTPGPRPADGEVLTVKDAAKRLGVSASTLHRYLNDGIIVGEHLTPCAPWRIRITEELRARFLQAAPQGYLTMWQAMHALGVSRQTVMQRVKRGELETLYINQGRRKGLRIKVLDNQIALFGTTPAEEV